MRSPIVQLVAISTTTVSLTVMCVTLVIASNLDNLADRWSRGLGMICFIADDVPDERLADLADDISGWAEVETTTVYTKERAFDDLNTVLGDDRRLLAGLEKSVLPASLEIVLARQFRTPESRQSLALRLKQLPDIDIVEKVDFGSDMMSKMKRLREYLQLAGFAIALLVLSAVVFIITNTVRLTLYARKDEIEVMRLVGANGRFIRIPFYLEGAFQGAVGASFALFITWLALSALPMAEFVSDMQSQPPNLQFIDSGSAFWVVFGAALIGILASHLATSRFLREND
ncbi:MAG: permease-like cell division protein FtsX [Myxococcota bacterium]|nr:permease-like cell division protein FtsX [Myxococcota bacterium]